MSPPQMLHPDLAPFSTGDFEIPRKVDDIRQTSSPKLQRSPIFYTRISVSPAQAESCLAPSSESGRSTSGLVPKSPPSYRRSVSGMKKLLPLKLRSTPPTPSVASWLNNTTPHPNMPFDSITESWQDLGPNDVPWMQSRQEELLLTDIRPVRYRETPVYSEPGSPKLVRAYFGKDDPCHTCLPPGSACDELCIITKYEESAKSGASCSQDSYDECEESLHSGEIGRSTQTSPTSAVSSRLSDLSIKCRGELPRNDEAVKLGGKLLRLASPFESCGFSKDANVDIWTERESSRCSSPAICDEVCDALATPLSPAKATVIQVPRYPEYPFIVPLRSEPLPPGYHRPATPFRSTAHLRTIAVTPSKSQKVGTECNEPKDLGRKTFCQSEEMQERNAVTPPALSFRRRDRRTQGWLNLKRPKFTTEPISTPIGIMTTFQEPTLTPPASPTYRHTEPESPSRSVESQDSTLQFRKPATNTTVESISEAIRGFPLEMLSIDSHCVAEIRRRNQYLRLERSLGLLSSTSSPALFSETQPRQSFRRRAKTSSLFAPLRHTHSNKSILSDSKDDEIFSSKTSQHSLTPSWIEPDSNLQPPDLKSLRIIFPNTDDWWRSILYAHLIAHNYIRGLQKSSELSSKPVPFKAAMRLGISRDTALLGLEARQDAELPDDTLLDVIDGLISCINQITGCMEGSRSDPLGGVDGAGAKKADLSLIRAMAEVVNTCETRGWDQN